jgi:hypothetical protein
MALETLDANDNTTPCRPPKRFEADCSIAHIVSPVFNSKDHWLCFAASQKDQDRIANSSGTYGNDKANAIVENIMMGIAKSARGQSCWPTHTR